jgi:hypothetical protein
MKAFLGSSSKAYKAKILRSNLALWVKPYNRKKWDAPHYVPIIVLWIYKFCLNILGIHFCPHFVSKLTKSILPSSHVFLLLASTDSVQPSTEEQHREYFTLISCYLPEPLFILLAFMSLKLQHCPCVRTLHSLSVLPALSFSQMLRWPYLITFTTVVYVILLTSFCLSPCHSRLCDNTVNIQSLVSLPPLKWKLKIGGRVWIPLRSLD